MFDDRWRNADEVLWVALYSEALTPLARPKDSVEYTAWVKNLSVARDVWVEVVHELDDSSCLDFDNGERRKVTPGFKLGRRSAEKRVVERLTRSARAVIATPSTITTKVSLRRNKEDNDVWEGPTRCVDCDTPD